MSYIPLNYSKITAAESCYIPSMAKNKNNKTYAFWERALFQRACSTLELTVPESWKGTTKDFLYYCLFRYGYVAVFDTDDFGTVFNPCNLKGISFYYQPTGAIVTNPALEESLDLTIGDTCEIIKLTPDYQGVWDIIAYYAEKLSILDNAINMSLINNKFAYFLGARNKAAAETLKKAMDKVNRGEPAVILDVKLPNDPNDKDVPWQFLERTNLKNSYLTTDQLQDFQTLLNGFDTEIGIPTIPYQKKERMVTSEAESKVIDSTSRSMVWYETLSNSLDIVNAHYNLGLKVELRYKPEEGQEVAENERDNSYRNE